MAEVYLSPYLIIAALILDFILGESDRMPHPVIWFGKVINWSEENYNDESLSSFYRKVAGLVLALLLPLVVYILTFLLLKFAFYLGWTSGILMALLLAYMTLSARGLRDAAHRVYDTLNKDDLSGAREALSHVVGRDTSRLDEPEIVRATIETVAENSSDGVIAPLLYLIIGGVPLAMAYKAINTLDSMVAYKNEKYCDFGWASARLDDMVNYIPARLTALLIVFSAWFLDFDWKRSWKMMLRDCRNHPSPMPVFPRRQQRGPLVFSWEVLITIPAGLRKDRLSGII